VYSAARPAEPIYSEDQRRNDERRNRIIAYDAYLRGLAYSLKPFLTAKPIKGRNSASGRLPGNGTRHCGQRDRNTQGRWRFQRTVEAPTPRLLLRIAQDARF